MIIIPSRRRDPAVITANLHIAAVTLAAAKKYGVIRGLDPPAGPKPLRRGEGPRIHPKAVIPGRASSREPGIQNSARLWIPGLRPRGRIPE
jgi:hypothetical protein